jgi:histidinol phosphatase-like PHP family hydrolase
MDLSNSALIQALGRWSHDPTWSERGQKALRRAALSLTTLDLSIAGEAATGRLERLRWVGPFVARVLSDLLAGRRPLAPDPAAWPEAAQQAYAAVSRYDTFLAIHDARRIAAERGFPTIRGDLQTHTTWSDGRASPKTMARAAINLGHEYLAITDHSQGLRIARGLSPERMARQRQTIRRMALDVGIDLLVGIEVNVSPEGEVDLSLEDLTAADIVVAGCHSHLRRPEDQTARLVAAVRHPGVHVLGHPRGRLFGTVRTIRADWAAVFEAAAASGTAVEINASADRQDVDFELARLAAQAGCWISLGTDAHAAEELALMDLARGHAALAGVSPGQVLNFMTSSVLRQWLAGNRREIRGRAAGNSERTFGLSAVQRERGCFHRIFSRFRAFSPLDGLIRPK